MKLMLLLTLLKNDPELKIKFQTQHVGWQGKPLTINGL